MFQIMYANTEEKLKKALDALNAIKHQKYVGRVKSFLDRGKEWMAIHRISLKTRGNNTNNYSEATIRILKDVVLCRTKAFNIVALIDFCLYVWEDYYVTRILDFAHNRRVNKKLYFKNITSSNAKIVPVEDSDDCFNVQSFTNSIVFYEVNSSVGFCSCPKGSSGAFCKHQAVVQDKYGNIFPSPPVTSAEGRHSLGKLALGSACPPLDFFLGLTEKPTESSSVPYLDTSRQNDFDIANNSENPDLNQNVAADSDEDFSDFVNPPRYIDHWPDFLNNLNRLQALSGNNSVIEAALKKINCSLGRVVNEPQAVDILLSIKNAVCGGIKTGGKIKVQPTSIARRRPSATRGSKRIAEGRPAANTPASRPKRPRILAQNINNNVPHAKSHGSGH
jgi:hypothetical protein